MSRRLDLIFVLTLASVVAFCGMGYELLIVRLVSELSGDAVTSQSLTVGLFLLSLGFGAYLCGRKNRGLSWTFLMRVEIFLSLSAVVILPAITLLSLYVRTPLQFIFCAQSATLLIGTLCGFELPVLINAAKTLTRRSFGSVLAASYIGSLTASILLPYVFIPSFGVSFSGWALALVSAAVAASLYMRAASYRLSLDPLFLAIAIFLPAYATSLQDSFEQFYLKSFYYVAPARFDLENLKLTRLAHENLPRVQRFTTKFQDIDIVRDDLSPYGLGSTRNFHLFIDQHKQFSSTTETIYHDTIVHGGLNLARQMPEHVLIVGGGDGLMVRELLKYPSLKSITLVELDPEMIHLAMTFPDLRTLNQGALSSPKVKIEIADGFTWVRDNRDFFDSIFIDLPHPVSPDLSRLYSLEFYTFVKRRLSPQGFVVFDFPFDGILKSSAPGSTNRETLRKIRSALSVAGFSSQAVFGSWESFMIARANPFDFRFDYSTLSPLVHDDAVFNMTMTEMNEPETEPNTVYKPVVLKPSGGGN